jgi:hypothetical protein
LWSARCSETGTAGAGGGSGKLTGGNTGRAPRADLTVRWIRNKYRRYDKTRAARRKFAEITSGYPRMFWHWRWVTSAW